jgi:hypothetical protein
VRVAKRGVGDANLHLFLSGHGNIPFLVEIIDRNYTTKSTAPTAKAYK